MPISYHDYVLFVKLAYDSDTRTNSFWNLESFLLAGSGVQLCSGRDQWYMPTLFKRMTPGTVGERLNPDARLGC
jgi:hypothetical protein